MHSTLSSVQNTHSSSESYFWRGFPGYGVSFSSTKAVLRAAADLFQERGHPASNIEVAKLALAFERARCAGRGIAAQDVYPIVEGGLVETRTYADGRVIAEQIPCDPAWISDHALFAYHPSGERHDVPGLLDSLLDDVRAARFVRSISRQAILASDGFRSRNLKKIARAMTEYRKLFFEDWGNGSLINPRVFALAEDLQDRFGDKILAWKPPGGGAASSIVVITKSAHSVLRFLRDSGWYASPAIPAAGLKYKRCTTPGGPKFVFSAPHRIDWVGAADLGSDTKILVDGVCCGLAIEPRSEVWISSCK